MKIQNGISLVPPSAEARAKDQDESLRGAAKMYEKHFLNEMVKAMRSTTGGEDGVVKKNFAEKIFTEQLDQQYVDNWSNKGGVGLADMIYTQIKDQYFGSANKHIQNLPHALPIAPKQNPINIPSPEPIQMKAIPSGNDNKMSYRFEAPAGQPAEAQAPLPGTVTDVKALENGWSSVKLDHGQGLRSEMTFPGRLAPLNAGDNVAATDKIGTLDPARPVLAWNLDWT